MQQANIMLALGGNLGQTIQKFGVTPAEVAVLREIHGNAAVFDIQPLDEEVERTSREERSRLLEVYGKPPGSHELSAVEFLFPGAAARVYENFDELELDESFYKATGRAKPKVTKAKAKVEEPEPEPDDEVEEDDEVEDDEIVEPKPKKTKPKVDDDEDDEPKAKRAKPPIKKPTKSLFK
jgi:hypothetical protein